MDSNPAVDRRHKIIALHHSGDMLKKDILYLLWQMHVTGEVSGEADPNNNIQFLEID